MNSSKKISFPAADEITAAIDASGQKGCRDLSNIFVDKAGRATDNEWKLLQQVFNFHFKSSNVMQPFAPIAVMTDGTRSMIPDDLTNTQLDELQGTLDGVTDPEYRARVGDVLWLRRKDAKAARIAVKAYLEAGKLVEHPKNWTTSMERYERALRLAGQIEPKGNLPKTILAHLESRVLHYDGKDPLYFTCKALRLLAEFRYGGFSTLAKIAGHAAGESRSDKDFRRARSYFEVQAKHLKLAGEAAAAEAARVTSARTFVEEAENREANNEFMAAHSFWGNAISAFRYRPSLRKEIPELQRRYSIAGGKLGSEMRTVSSDGIDITKFVEESRASVAELPWEDAFFTLASFIPLIDPKELRETTEKELSEPSIHTAMAASIYDASGRKIGVRPSALTDDPAQKEKAISGFMEQNAGYQRHMMIHAHIAPAIRQIIEDHEVEQATFSSVLDDSALIPKERRELFYQAFEVGFRLDFSTALHLLIPQVENALRYVLQQNGISPVNVDNDGVEEVWGMKRVLSHAKTLEIFGDSLVFELKSLLVARLGPNLRNLFAHGALSPNGFSGENAIYLWWVILQLAAYRTSGMHAYMERRQAENGHDQDKDKK
ncbi:MAG: DUF4209 domain-containing protein [Robiginitomaculum sp.]|nr:DUF4209 domain-containing protein [Robiginitomaculum sp.]